MTNNATNSSELKKQVEFFITNQLKTFNSNLHKYCPAPNTVIATDCGVDEKTVRRFLMNPLELRFRTHCAITCSFMKHNNLQVNVDDILPLIELLLTGQDVPGNKYIICYIVSEEELSLHKGYYILLKHIHTARTKTCY